jgi:hypothetical protein
MKAYVFKPTNDINQVNWDIITQFNKWGVIYPLLNGFSQGFCYGYLSLDGPRVHLYLWIYGAPIWGDDSYIELPNPPIQLITAGVKVDFDQFLGPIVDVDTRQALNDEYYKLTTSPDGKKCRLLFPNSGSITTSGTLTGSYIRN